MVSICIPAYNSWKSLERLLLSILDQTYVDYEVIITDDSTQLSVEEGMAPYLKDSRIRYIKNEKSLGATANNNKAISLAKGCYIKVMHHDDFFSYSDSLKKMVDMMEREESDIVFCGTRQVSENYSYSRSINDNQVKALKRNYRFVYYKNVIGAPSATLFRNTGIIFDSNLSWLVDVDLYLRILSGNTNIVYTKDDLVSIGISENQLTNDCIRNKKLVCYENKYVMRKHGLYVDPRSLMKYFVVRLYYAFK